MVFAVAMTFIDQTIVAIAIPNLQKDLRSRATGAQWIINGYLLALSALFAFGGKLGDVLGRRRMVVIGVVGFAVASALCGADARPAPRRGVDHHLPRRSRARPRRSCSRPPSGSSSPSFPLRERGQAMAIFFGISGGLTAIGPIAGGYLTQWTWRSIFWINIPVALIALYPDLAREARGRRRTRRRSTTAAPCSSPAAMGLLVLGFQQSSAWGWSSAATWACILVGLALLASRSCCGSCARRSRCWSCGSSATAASRPRPWCSVLMSIVFVPFFFFASVYAQVVARRDGHPTPASTSLYFFLGFVIAAQIGGRILDTARRAARGRARRRARRGRLLPAGRQADRPLARRTSGRTSCSPAPGSA